MAVNGKNTMISHGAAATVIVVCCAGYCMNQGGIHDIHQQIN